jgi:hypothetical protein
MSAHVLQYIAFLGETKVALVNWTYKGFLTCMDPKVVKKIVPFSKNFLAILEITQENLGPSFGTIFLRLYKEKLSGLWQQKV